MLLRSRVRAFVVLGLACAVAAVAVTALTIAGAAREREASERAVRAAAPRAGQILASGRPFAVFRDVDRSHPESYGRTAVAPLRGTTAGEPALVGPPCRRVAYGGGKALCLDVLGTEMSASVLDGRLRTLHDFTLAGIPSRARISPDGRWGGITAFVVGHAYAKPGEFSTAATIVDMRRGKAVADLEKDFTVTRDGKRVTARDRNFWGLTFDADGDTFYATMATGGRTYLIRGSIARREARTIHENVECPSLSPDGKRIGYKKAVAHDPTRWRFHVLDLATDRETALAEPRSIDDQLAWLDDDNVLYGDGKRMWTVPADGSGAARPWIEGGDSATVAAAAA